MISQCKTNLSSVTTNTMKLHHVTAHCTLTEQQQQSALGKDFFRAKGCNQKRISIIL